VNGAAQTVWNAGSSFNVAFGASADGSVVVGSEDAFGGGRNTAVKYENGQVTQLTTFTMGAYAMACSADGSVIVGGGGALGFRWTSAGPQSLAPLAGHTETWAYGVSADGQTIVGQSARNTNTIRAVEWIGGSTGTPTALPFPTGFTSKSQATDISADASTVVGWVQNGSFIRRACKWSGGTAINLGALSVTTGQPMSQANGCSSDGSVIIGTTGHTDTTSEHIADPIAFVWTPQTGMEDFRSYLARYGVNAAGWNFETITGVSDDGRTFTGDGYDPTGAFGPWIATVPAPGTSVVVGLATICLSRRRRGLARS
jgi:uncharacterized membrane protein